MNKSLTEQEARRLVHIYHTPKSAAEAIGWHVGSLKRAVGRYGLKFRSQPAPKRKSG